MRGDDDSSPAERRSVLGSAIFQAFCAAIVPDGQAKAIMGENPSPSIGSRSRSVHDVTGSLICSISPWRLISGAKGYHHRVLFVLEKGVGWEPLMFRPERDTLVSVRMRPLGTVAHGTHSVCLG